MPLRVSEMCGCSESSAAQEDRDRNIHNMDEVVTVVVLGSPPPCGSLVGL